MNRITLSYQLQDHLSRANLDKKIAIAVEKPLSIIVAGTGYGKTKAVAKVLQTRAKEVIWMQIEKKENRENLWACFKSAFTEDNKKLRNSLRKMEFPSTPATFYLFLKLLEEELFTKKKFVLVLDDFHRIQDEAILKFFEMLIIAKVHNLSIVIISRTNPKLKLMGMHVKDLLVRITQEDFCFTKKEIEQYFEVQEISADIATIDNILKTTEGWPFAIYLLGRCIKGRKNHIENPISLIKKNIFARIEKEIFSEISEQVQNFLVLIELLEVIPVGLARELIDYNSFVVSELVELSMFVFYDSCSDSYKLHPMFKLFIHEQKNKLNEKDINKIHWIAEKWYERNNNLIEALNTYKKCNSYNEIFDIILSIKTNVVKEVADIFIQLIEEAPSEFIKKRPIMEVIRARYLLYNNYITESYHILLVLQKKYEKLPCENENINILGEIYILMGLVSLAFMNKEFSKFFELACDCLPEGSKIFNESLNLMGSISFCFIRNAEPGEVEKFQAAFFTAMPYVNKVMNGCGYGLEYLVAAEIAYMRGDIISAEKNAYEAIYRAEQKKQIDVELRTFQVLIHIYKARGEFIKIKEILESFRRKKEGREKYIIIYDIIEALFFVELGEYDKIAKWIFSKERETSKRAPVYILTDYVIRCLYYLDKKRYKKVLDILEPIKAHYKSRHLLMGLIYNYNFEAIAYYNMNNKEKAVTLLQESYELAHENGIIMPYVEFGNRLIPVVQYAIQERTCQIPKEWLEDINIRLVVYAKQMAGVAFDYFANEMQTTNSTVDLNKIEREVLSHLSRGKTLEEIGKNCYLSVSALKSMIQSIYGKLHVQNSIDAVRMAIVMKII